MISMVMLSWERVGNVIVNIEKYSSYNVIDEIIVFNNNSKYKLGNIKNNKLTIIDSSKDLGLYSRFAAAGLARNECIMHCDDDLIIPETTIYKLYEYWLKSPTLCHGTQGRIVTDDYNMKPAFGDVQIVLTRCMLVSKSICLSAFEFSNSFSDLTSEPRGNGEDIIMSYISISKSGELNKSFKLPYTDYPCTFTEEDLTTAISKRWKHHVEHRSKIVKRCKTLLGLS